MLKKMLARGKNKDKGKNFDRSKVQMELICDGCNAHQCVYSNKMVGSKCGPTQSDVWELQRWLGGGNMCAYKVPGDKFYVQEKKNCSDYIESQYYNHLYGKKVNKSSRGRGFITGNVCAI